MMGQCIIARRGGGYKYKIVSAQHPYDTPLVITIENVDFTVEHVSFFLQYTSDANVANSVLGGNENEFIYEYANRPKRGNITVSQSGSTVTITSETYGFCNGQNYIFTLVGK